MTIRDLQTGIADELTALFSDFARKTPSGADRTLQVFLDRTPEPTGADADEESIFPFAVVKVLNGSVEEWNDMDTVSVVVVLGLHDEGANADGVCDVLNMVERIKLRFLANPYLAGKSGSSATLDLPLRWASQDADAQPGYFYGGVEMKWHVPAILVEDALA